MLDTIAFFRYSGSAMKNTKSLTTNDRNSKGATMSTFTLSQFKDNVIESVFFQIVQGQLTANYTTFSGVDGRAIISNFDELEELIRVADDDVNVMLSSSISNPTEHTRDETTIALCNAIAC